MKRPQFKLRTLMIAVVVTALPAWAYRLKCRSMEFERIADIHELNAIEFYNGIMALYGAPLWRPGDPQRPLTDAEKVQCANLEHRLRFEMCMYHKYHYAKSFPWLPVSPDPDPLSNPPRDCRWIRHPDPISDFCLTPGKWHHD